MHHHNPPCRLVETTSPTIEPLTLAEVKTFLRVDQGNDDNLIGALITAARQFCESNTGRSLITRSYSLYTARGEAGRRPFTLPTPPLLSVTQVNIYAADNIATVFN